MKQVGHPEIQRVQTQLHPRTGPPTRPERQELEVAPLEVRHPFLEKPGRLEHVRFGPRVPVASDGERVDHHPRPLRDGVAAHLRILRRLVEEQRDRRVEAQRLLERAFQEAQLLKVALFDPAVQTDNLRQLLLNHSQVLRALHQFSHSPLDC
ncbi:unnamed protein product [Linum tenue]|uniref:Uncharacterized protein n=1 Tax=Linum tenue TaxID=586396 RepID=A0AAV0NU22_9ROSI|nr:unnamed protein product [Linum tenue]